MFSVVSFELVRFTYKLTCSTLERSFVMPNKVSFDFVDGFLIVKVDLNQDGQPLLELKINAMEVPDEVLSLIQGKKNEVKAA